MHEFSIASAMLDTVLKQAARNRAASVVAVKARIGELAGVVQEALEFAWQTLTEETLAAGSKLEIEHVPVACYCAPCHQEFVAKVMSYRCPRCGQLSAELLRGRELELVSIEVN